MPTSYVRGANPFWNFFYPNGNINGGAFATGSSITFYDDANRSEKKSVYADPAGTVPLANPLSVGDLGEIGPSVYFADDAPYYIEIRLPNGTTRAIETYRPSGSGGGGSTTVGLDFENQLLNGQFRFNYDNVDTITTDELSIANNWTFKKNNTSATDQLRFQRFNLGDNVTEATPIYRFRYTCTGQGTGETTKDLKQILKDVRTFEQTPLTLSMAAFSDSTRTVEALYIQHFGTGGSPSADVVTTIASFNLTGGETNKVSNTFTPPSVSGKTLGTNNDDYVAIVLRFPLNATCDIWVTNIYLSIGDKALTYPRMTEEQEDALLLGSMIPKVEKEDYGKSIIATRNRQYELAFAFPVGMASPYFGQSYTNDDNWALCDGLTVDVKQDNERYKRLYGAIGHHWGRPDDGWVTKNNGDLVNVLVTKTSAVTVPSNGTTSPGFTIGQYATGSPANNHFTANIVGNEKAKIRITNLAVGSAAFITNDVLADAHIYLSGNAKLKQVREITTKAGSAITGGQHFSIYNNATTGFTFWYKVGGVGTEPVVANTTKVLVEILATDTAEEVAFKTLTKMTGFQLDTIKTVAANTIPAGAYVNVNTSTRQYYFWFKVGGAGIDPSLPDRTGVMIELAIDETAIQVAEKLSAAIDAQIFKIPDVQGMVIRGYDPNHKVDFDLRSGAGVGSIQYQQVIGHTHPFSYTTYSELDTADGGGAAKWTLTSTANSTTSTNLDAVNGGFSAVGTGGYETRQTNVAANYLIKL